MLTWIRRARPTCFWVTSWLSRSLSTSRMAVGIEVLACLASSEMVKPSVGFMKSWARIMPWVSERSMGLRAAFSGFTL